MSDGLQPAAVLDALKRVVDPEFGKDLVALGMAKQVTVADGRVAFTLELPTPAHPLRQRLRDEAEAAVAALPGVSAVDLTVTANVKAVTKPEHGGTPLPTVKNIIAVGAGKGGVGKTTVSVNMALALSQMGAKVGILDGDVYGPHVPLMFGISTELGTDGEKILPAEKFGVQIVSMAFLAKDDQALIWRGPMLQRHPPVLHRGGVEGPRLSHHRHAARHRRRGALAQPDGEGGRGRRGDDAAGGVARRHAARREDVREAHDSHARPRGEHELLRLPELPHRK
jgi:metal-sulfur cluster biosynthetic enzyme